MLSILNIVLPIFALILAGFLCRRMGVLGAQATSELNRFVVVLALPALMFDITVHTGWASYDQPGFIAAFGLGTLGVFAATVIWRRRMAQPLADASVDGLNVAYPNVGYMGLPLCLLVFGRESLALAAIGAVLIACALFAMAIVLIETGLNSGARRGRLAGKVALSLGKNPLLIAPVAGALLAGSGVALPGGIDAFFHLLGNAASPCALVTLGLFIAQTKPPRGRDAWACGGFVAAKLLAQPALTWALAVGLHLPPLGTHVAVLLAMLPTGTGPFMLAEFYRREAAVTASTIMVSTVVSLVTISVYLACIG